MNDSKAINGHGCGGCYVRWEYKGDNLCKSEIIDGGKLESWMDDRVYRDIAFRVITTDLSTRPDWCPLK